MKNPPQVDGRFGKLDEKEQNFLFDFLPQYESFSSPWWKFSVWISATFGFDGYRKWMSKHMGHKIKNKLTMTTHVINEMEKASGMSYLEKRKEVSESGSQTRLSV